MDHTQAGLMAPAFPSFLPGLPACHACPLGGQLTRATPGQGRKERSPPPYVVRPCRMVPDGVRYSILGSARPAASFPFAGQDERGFHGAPDAQQRQPSPAQATMRLDQGGRENHHQALSLSLSLSSRPVCVAAPP
ncbi:hypothetical protein GGTG_08150 [Gaeumannomyces tritici R3-111a-1]|uniref:Uncharacterized protein n=1 Tax=Gaeumannomyces tritici (strain R3-111a-1) TaxID=644352 RepID=J3P3R4_GAET3|nr:hypothetical protein GGTG_08150 [Gaeumannomyces tritici R3-111a-1]EJT74308.1 hypothetical protein GGTG_08150 [Gaeumannomyces tritici R3-111a-1]